MVMCQPTWSILIDREENKRDAEYSGRSDLGLG